MPRHATSGSFKPGQSGNPGGQRKATRDFRARTQEFMQKSGWPILEQMASDPKSPYRYRAIELIAAYAHGRPTQPIAGDIDPEMPPVQVTVTFDRADTEDTPSST